jgi:uncharacterized membrane protein
VFVETAVPLKPRVVSVDALRGFVMIVMALDHVRDFTSSSAFLFQPDDLTRTSAALFFTRWITHFCAPVFMFTAGIGAYFRATRGQTTGELSRFLVTRGLWLVLLELTAVRLAFSFGRGPVILEVLWALGWSMVLLALLVHLPVRWLAVSSIATIALHNLADGIRDGWFWNVLHRQAAVPVGSTFVVVAYPLVPWFAVMAAGYCFGRVMTLDTERRRRWLLRIGWGVTAAFLSVRGVNIYGDPQKWSRAIPGMAVLSFLRVAKYPPSLDFLLMTLGPAILLLWWLDRLEIGDKDPLMVFGRVPLFYFVVHLFLIHGLAVLLAVFRYGHAGFMLSPLPSMGGAAMYPPDYGYGLGGVYAIWLTVVILMYPLCRWFAGVKRRRRDWWLSYV